VTLSRGQSVRSSVRQSAQLGEVVVALFDLAARHSSDPRRVSGLAATAVALMLRPSRRISRLRASFQSSVSAPTNRKEGHHVTARVP
jgi:hypothetical protein